METDSVSYAKEHRRDFFSKLIKNKKITSPKTAIFMAGTPGAGKTEVAESLALIGRNLIRIDADWFRVQFPGYNGKNSSDFQRGAAWLVEWSLSRIIEKGYSFILDGTFAFSRATLNIQRALDHHYDTSIYFVYQEPQIAWQFTKIRELKEGRVVPKESFINAYFKSRENVAKAKSVFSDELYLTAVFKDYQNNIEDSIEDIQNIELVLPDLFKKQTLEEILDG